MSSSLKEAISSSKQFWKTFSSTFGTSSRLRVGSILFAMLAGLALFEHPINNYRIGRDPTSYGSYSLLLPMSFEHPLGTDHFGRDVLALQLLGLKYSLLIGVIAGGMATLIGVAVAVTAGYMGGKWDLTLNSLVNTLLVLPLLPIAMVLVAYVKVDLILLSLFLAIFSWPWTARAVRAQILTLKERPFVELAKVSGLNSYEIMFMEILPNLIPYIGAGFAGSVVGTILAETGLRLVGLGPGNLPSLGFLLYWAMSWGFIAQRRYQMVAPPILLLVLTFVSLNLINSGLEEIFNPRLKKVTGL